MKFRNLLVGVLILLVIISAILLTTPNTPTISVKTDNVTYKKGEIVAFTYKVKNPTPDVIRVKIEFLLKTPSGEERFLRGALNIDDNPMKANSEAELFGFIKTKRLERGTYKLKAILINSISGEEFDSSTTKFKIK